jgi:hypothetical protein
MLGSSPHEDVKNGILLDKIFRTPFDDRKVVLIHVCFNSESVRIC